MVLVSQHHPEISKKLSIRLHYEKKKVRMPKAGKKVMGKNLAYRRPSGTVHLLMALNALNIGSKWLMSHHGYADSLQVSKFRIKRYSGNVYYYYYYYYGIAGGLVRVGDCIESGDFGAWWQASVTQVRWWNLSMVRSLHSQSSQLFTKTTKTWLVTMVMNSLGYQSV